MFGFVVETGDESLAAAAAAERIGLVRGDRGEWDWLSGLVGVCGADEAAALPLIVASALFMSS